MRLCTAILTLILPTTESMIYDLIMIAVTVTHS